ncbi:hypothetical protein QJS04_geneDACA009152 [Acorus gramineus]|uniref:Uncharacterized protein n=1 Tax=Acorus gramineus TaxID=55184 RepID=A0AAV9ASR3_ACOGR|nr:hypothetical protein QJS04_geneDACA009152 [Acorus gramineus]
MVALRSGCLKHCPQNPRPLLSRANGEQHPVGGSEGGKREFAVKDVTEVAMVIQ